MGNGAKAAQKRERNAKNGPGASAKSQLKQNEQAKNIMCSVCRATFLCTSSIKSLTEHSENKHGKGVKDCFPMVSV